MKIIRIDVYAKRYTLAKGEYAWSGGNAIYNLDTTIIKLTTDEGLFGFGESCPLGPAYLPAFALGTRAGAQEIAPALIGVDPRHPRAVNARMDAALVGHPYAKSAFDSACWDILGKASGQSVSVLLGGRFREEWPLYMAVSQGSPAQMADETAALRAEGYRAFQLKVGGDPLEDVARIDAVLGVTEPGDAVIADANTGWLTRDAARVVRALEGRDVYIEQPCKTYEECLFIRQRTTLPFVLDEVITSIGALLRGYQDRAMEAINLKIARFGGLTRAKEVRDLCEALGISMTIEDSMGGDIATAGITHLVASTRPEFVFTTTCMNTWVKERFAGGAPEARNGRSWAPTGPGLGIQVDESWLGEPLLTVR